MILDVIIKGRSKRLEAGYRFPDGSCLVIVCYRDICGTYNRGRTSLEKDVYDLPTDFGANIIAPLITAAD